LSTPRTDVYRTLASGQSDCVSLRLDTPEMEPATITTDRG